MRIRRIFGISRESVAHAERLDDPTANFLGAGLIVGGIAADALENPIDKVISSAVVNEGRAWSAFGCVAQGMFEFDVRRPQTFRCEAEREERVIENVVIK